LAAVAGGLAWWYFTAADAPPAPSAVVAARDAAATPDVEAAPAAADSTAHYVIAYYFHTTYRCSSCRRLEAWTRQAIDTGFSAELADGRLIWRVVNVEKRGNEHFVKDYQLFTKSVVLSEQQSGREVRWKNLARVWELLADEADFVDYVQTETHSFLDGTP
jgi:hypothetical protein